MNSRIARNFYGQSSAALMKVDRIGFTTAVVTQEGRKSPRWERRRYLPSCPLLERLGRMQIDPSVIFEELLIELHMEDGKAEDRASSPCLVMLKKTKYMTSNKMGYVICKGRDCEINGRTHNAKVGD